MVLIPQSLKNRIPKLRETEQEEDPMIWVKLFFPDFSWSWYIIEYDGDDLCFGWVDGDFPELGYFRLSELYMARGKLGLPIERDRFFRPVRLTAVQAQCA